MFSKQLALRDPAKAARFGIIAASVLESKGTNFGFGDDMGDEMGDEMGFGDEMHGFGAAAPAPTPAQLHAAHRHLQRQHAHTNKRLMRLDPNKHSAEKVEEYIFPLNASLMLGTPNGNVSTTSTPDAEIRPQRVTVNAPNYGFFYFSQLKIGNVSVIIGGSSLVDAFTWGAQAVGQKLDFPTMQTQTKGTFAGTYNGMVPAGFLANTTYVLAVTFSGPSRMVG